MKWTYLFVIVQFGCVICQILDPVSITSTSRRELMIIIVGKLLNRSITNLDIFITINERAVFNRDMAKDEDNDFGGIHVIETGDPLAPDIFVRNMEVSVLIKANNSDHTLLTLSKVNMFPGSPYHITNLNTSDFYFSINFDLTCDFFAGENCHLSCPEFNRDEEFCDPIDARIRFNDLQRHQGDRCTNNICSNGSQCYTNSRNRSQCECGPTQCGETCEVSICKETCNPIGGFCDLSGGCRCNKGFEGTRCEMATCKDFNPCLNNGRCVVKDNKHECVCSNVEMFGGTLCEVACNTTCTGGVCIDFGGPVCFFDRLAVTTLPPGTTTPPKAEPYDLAKNLNLSSLKTAAIIISIYTVVVVLLLIFVKRIFASSLNTGMTNRLATVGPADVKASDQNGNLSTFDASNNKSYQFN